MKAATLCIIEMVYITNVTLSLLVYLTITAFIITSCPVAEPEILSKGGRLNMVDPIKYILYFLKRIVIMIFKILKGN